MSAFDKYGLVSEDIKRQLQIKPSLFLLCMRIMKSAHQPIAEIGKLAKEKGIYFHTDAVQTVAISC